MTRGHSTVKVIFDPATETPSWIVLWFGRIYGGRHYRYGDARALARRLQDAPAWDAATWQEQGEALRGRKVVSA